MSAGTRLWRPVGHSWEESGSTKDGRQEDCYHKRWLKWTLEANQVSHAKIVGVQQMVGRKIVTTKYG